MFKNKLTYQFFILYFVLFYGLGVFIPYINVWFEKALHFNGVQIGQINAISMLVGIAFAPMIGMICDKTHRFKQILITMLIIMLILLQIYQRQSTYFGVMIIAIIFEIFKSGSFPIVDVLGSDFGEKNQVPFGMIRTFGSLGFMIGSILTGMLIDKIGYNGSIFTAFSVSVFLAVICLSTIPNSHKQIVHQKNEHLLKIITNKKFFTLFIYIICTTTIIDASTSFIGNYLTVTLDAPKYLISIFTLCMVLPEILFLPFSMRILNKFGYQKFYLLSACIIFVRLMVTGLVRNPWVVIFMPLLHFTSIIISTVGNIHFFRKNFNASQIATVLTLFTACVGITRAAYNMIFGYIYYQFGGNAIYIFGGCLTCIAIVTIAKTTIFDEKALQ